MELSVLRFAVLGAISIVTCLGAPGAQAKSDSNSVADSLDGCPSKAILSRLIEFGKTGKMPPDLGRWLGDPEAQAIEPYRAFDNVQYVGVCWVSAWLVKTSDGYVLIDTLHEPFVDLLIDNIRKLGDLTFTAYETPGHTFGTASYGFDVMMAARPIMRSPSAVWA